MADSRRVPAAERHWVRVLGTLNELQARVFVAQKALAEGRGAISRLSRLTGMSRPTIMKGMAELQGTAALPRAERGRIRRPGAGRKPVVAADPAVARGLKRILEASTRSEERRVGKECRSRWSPYH